MSIFNRNSFVFICAMLSFLPIYISAQNVKAEVTIFEGIVVGGYVDEGAFLNFTGPNITIIKGNSRLIVGMMPSLRFKNDSGATQNTFVTPALGGGLTYCYKYLALQLPFYYTPKTSIENGKWHVGAGIGLRLNAFKRDNSK